MYIVSQPNFRIAKLWRANGLPHSSNSFKTSRADTYFTFGFTYQLRTTPRLIVRVLVCTKMWARLPPHQSTHSRPFPTAIFTKELSTSTTLIYSRPDSSTLSNYGPSMVVKAISAQICVGQVEKAAKGFLRHLCVTAELVHTNYHQEGFSLPRLHGPIVSCMN
jgi:hypothetical protein